MVRLGLLTHNFPLQPEETPDAGSFVSALAAMLQGHDCEVTVFCQSFGQEVQTPENIKIYQFPWKGQGQKLGQLRLTQWKGIRNLVSYARNGREGVLKFIRSYKIEHCLALWVVPSGYFAYYSKKRLGVPYSVWALGSDMNQYYRTGFRGIIQHVLREAENVFADGHDLVAKVNDASGENRCRFLPSSRPLLNGVADFKRNESVFRFLYVGRLEKVKGIDLLLSAFRELSKKEPRAILEIIGTGSLGSEINHFIARYDLKHCVLIRGCVTTEELREAYRWSHCLVIPSRSESLPLVFSEAMQFHLPVIATDVGDLGYFINKYDVGIVALPENVESLREGMETFVRMRSRWASGKMSHAAKDLSLESSVVKIKETIGVTN